MEISKVIKSEPQVDTHPIIKGRVLSIDELKRLTDFFSILIEIDQRNQKERRENEQKLHGKKTNAGTD